jgi:hypothetical protein
MNRRGFLRTTLAGAAAAVGAMVAGKVDAKEPTPNGTITANSIAVARTDTPMTALDTERAATLRRRAEDDARHAAALVRQDAKGGADFGHAWAGGFTPSILFEPLTDADKAYFARGTGIVGTPIEVSVGGTGILP